MLSEEKIKDMTKQRQQNKRKGYHIIIIRWGTDKGILSAVCVE
jgi:hypothetical protein